MLVVVGIEFVIFVRYEILFIFFSRFVFVSFDVIVIRLIGLFWLLSISIVL